MNLIFSEERMPGQVVIDHMIQAGVVRTGRKTGSGTD